MSRHRDSSVVRDQEAISEEWPKPAKPKPRPVQAGTESKHAPWPGPGRAWTLCLSLNRVIDERT